MGISEKQRIHLEKINSDQHGENNRNWRGGKSMATTGYVLLRNPKHPRAFDNGYVSEHIVIIENHLGRPLNCDEVVHHKNGKRDDNRVNNLSVLRDSEHRSKHTKIQMKDEKQIELRRDAQYRRWEEVRTSA